MKEHETRYPCMPQGREIHTAHGPECVLCGVLNPDERHYDSHKILPCSNKTLIARSYTRKLHLINHLKTHGIPDGSALAEKWRDTLDKKYFSCGFCIACFHSHADQLNHIDSAHYKSHQHISEWKSDNIILGLLLQPGVQQSWRYILTVHQRYNDSGFRWSSAAVKSLQLRLEKSEETANDLAMAAFNESTYDWRPNSRVESIPAAGFSNEDMDTYQHTPNAQHQAIPSQMLFAPNQTSVYDGGMMNTSLQAQHPAWRPIVTTDLSPSVLNANPTVYQNNSSREVATADHPLYLRDVQLEHSSINSNGWVPSHPPSHVPSHGLTFIPSDAYGGQMVIPSNLETDGNRQASSSPNPLAGHGGHQSKTGAGRTRTIATTQPRSLDFNALASPLTQTTSFPHRNVPSSLPTRPTKQPSRTKLKDHYDINTEADMDIDLDNIQYLMREEGHTRSERRHR